MSDEIQLHLLRHAHAGDPMKWRGPDSARPLSEKGRLQAQRIGRLLAQASSRPNAIVTSPKLRALETAQLVATELGLDVATSDVLAGPLDWSTLATLLTASGNPARPLLVGHDPDFSELAATLVGVEDLPLRKGALVRIDLDRPIRPGAGILRWLVTPDLLTGGE